MSVAFIGSAVRKAEALTRLERHAADGSLKFGATCWDGNSGTPLGVTIEGTDATDYSSYLGFPLALAAWLDPLTSAFYDDSHATQFARDWLTQVEPGADLSKVPSSIVSDLLVTSGAAGPFPELVERITALHERSGHSSPPLRSEWSAVRQAISETINSCTDAERHILGLCEAACWPLQNSHSVLTEVGRLWLQLAQGERDPEWLTQDRQRMELVMNRLGDEHRRIHGPDSQPNYPALFAAAEPELERRFVAHLAWQIETHRARAVSLGKIVLAALKRAAGTSVEAEVPPASAASA